MNTAQINDRLLRHQHHDNSIWCYQNGDRAAISCLEIAACLQTIFSACTEHSAARWRCATYPLLLLHCVLVSNPIHVEVPDESVVTACLVADYCQQLKKRLHLVAMVADVVEVTLGHAPCLKELTPLQMFLLCNSAQIRGPL